MNPIAIIPTYNESQNIAMLIALIRSECKRSDLDLLVVDSASPDGTAEVVRKIMASDSKVFLLEQPQKLGLGNAYLDGMRWVLARSYDAVVTMDADISHHPRYLDRMLGEIETHDLVIGSRYIPGGGLKDWPWARRMLSRFANGYAKTITGLPISDLTSGFQCFRTDLLARILRYPLRSDGYAFLIALKFWSMVQKASLSEIPIIFTDRTKGQTKISKRVILDSIFFVWKCGFQRKRLVR